MAGPVCYVLERAESLSEPPEKETTSLGANLSYFHFQTWQSEKVLGSRGTVPLIVMHARVC